MPANGPLLLLSKEEEVCAPAAQETRCFEFYNRYRMTCLRREVNYSNAYL